MKIVLNETDNQNEALLMAIYETEIHQLADLCSLQNDNLTAICFYREALDLRRIMYGSSSYEAASIEIKLSRILHKIGNVEAAKEITDHAFEVLRVLSQKGIEKAMTYLNMHAAFAA